MNYEEVIKHFGGPVKLAEALGIERQAVYQWKKKIPRLRQHEIEKLTDGKFTVSKPDAA